MRTTLLELDFDEASAAMEAGAVLVDLRPADDYLDVHIPGSIGLMYELGPGMAARARDCLPLEMPLVLLDPGEIDCAHAAASLRGKGFAVLGKVEDAINKWVEVNGTPASTEALGHDDSPPGTVLDVGDPGAEEVEDAVRIPVDHLWARAGELGNSSRVTVVAGFGVRAALAVGILERAGVEEVLVWRRGPVLPEPTRQFR